MPNVEPPPTSTDVSLKAGAKTTEFIATAAVGLTPVLDIIFKHDVTPQVQTWSTIAAGAAVIGYTAWRGILKYKQLGVKAALAAAEAELAKIGATASLS